MTDDQHGQGASQGGGRWDPLPQGDYDDGATAFVKLPEGGIDALLAARGDSPLAAPGHGYVPPQITATSHPDAATDPGATGTWAVPADAVQWPDPNAVPQEAGGGDQFTYHPGVTGQWNFEDTTVAESAPGHDVTGHWSIPVAGGDLPDESGEFTTSALVEQWGGTPPSTLPGGAPAPWATGATGATGQPWGQQALAQPPTPAPDAHTEPYAPAQPLHVAQEAPGADDAPEDVHGPAGAPEEATEPAAGPAAEAEEPRATPEEPAPELADEAAPDSLEHTAAPERPAAPADATPATPPHDDHPLASYVLRVNGSERPVADAWIGESLLYVLRERLGLAGAKDGCSQGECGACNVQVDGRLVASCLVPAVTAAGSEVRTVEGLAVDGRSSDVQRALARCGAVQCGFCVPGMAMTVHDLLEGNPAPTELETRQALCGNLCRCSGYRGFLDAVREVVAEREAHAAADAEPDADEARIPHQAGPGAGGVNASAFDPPGTRGTPGTPGPHDGTHDRTYGQDGGQA
ncbi:2Fe-2S iron-sulfur cluster-binding protein [Streptomyces sp. NPDC002928]|uniref:2Fe-2S iron-sulfur cluster-binding protein n=1 Tax=Streptomyces sp. NPDC002928 TaxID=3154440 RepID=UPI0033AC11FB